MLLTRNTRFTQQTLMQPLYVTLFIMLRGYLDEFQIAGAKNATQQIRNRLGAPTRNVSSSDGVTICEGQERNMLYNVRSKDRLPLKRQFVPFLVCETNKVRRTDSETLVKRELK